MDFIKGWTLSVCFTVIIAVLFSFLTPKGNMGKFFKIIISLFICISFFYPLSIKGFKSVSFDNQIITDSNTNYAVENMISSKIKAVLTKNDVIGADVNCDVYVNDKNEIEITSVQVAVSSNYELEFVKQLIFDELNIVARVIYVGE